MTTGQQFGIRLRIAKQLREIQQIAKDNDILLTDTTPHKSLAAMLDKLTTDLERQNEQVCCFPEFWKKPKVN